MAESLLKEWELRLVSVRGANFVSVAMESFLDLRCGGPATAQPHQSKTDGALLVRVELMTAHLATVNIHLVEPVLQVKGFHYLMRLRRGSTVVGHAIR